MDETRKQLIDKIRWIFLHKSFWNEIKENIKQKLKGNIAKHKHDLNLEMEDSVHKWIWGLMQPG